MIEYRDNDCLYLSVHGTRYLFTYAKSENTIYSVAFSDSESVPDVGNVILIQDGKVLWAAKFQRPNDVKVANDGTVLVNDWLKSRFLHSKVFAIRDGIVIFEQKLKAMLFCNAISNCGRYILYQTANSNNKDGNILCLHDLKNNQENWRKKGGPNWPSGFLIEPQNAIKVLYDKRDDVTLTWEGNIVGSSFGLSGLASVDDRF